MNQDILLTVTTLQDFVTQSPTPDTSQTRSLTIAINANQLPQTTSINIESGNRNGTRQLWDQLQRFAELLPDFSNLATFSLNVVSKGKNGFWIPRPLIASLIIALPQTCVAVQIDTQGQDLAEPKSAHLCNAIRTILPRLQHLRLRLSTICNSLFQAEAETIRAPSLETLLINCLGKSVQGHQTRLCGSFQEDPYYSQFYLGQEAAPVLALSMQALVPHCPQLTHMSLIDSGQRDDEDHSVYATFNRRNIMHNKIYCMPFVNIAPFQPDGVLMRTQDKDIIASLPALQTFAEEELWKATSPESFMLPAQLLEDWGYIADELPLLGVNEWKAKYPRKSCLLWINEQKTGQRLLDAVGRIGVVDAVIVKEATPEGWERVGGDLFAKE
ncbi:hypothetical protein OCU04_001015 [Sclerotinia nivalis]|uniref:Uncharacterized protein n=1 Tax=Sclerotinia nivalis TaxID=352851 RepID=A0A9X0AXW6_9HELO|nr:hypothetical protein OCU04_001015 [Sclerotinia nivalis]